MAIPIPFPKFSEDEEILRELLAFAYSEPHLYCDDGELQDNRLPWIDFRRDSAKEIQQKISDRNLVKYQQMVKEFGRPIKNIKNIKDMMEFTNWQIGGLK